MIIYIKCIKLELNLYIYIYIYIYYLFHDFYLANLYFYKKIFNNYISL